jgi:hypothetical protein
MKTCNVCKTTKPLDAFSYRSKAAGILLTQCKECKRAYNKERDQRPEVKSVRREQKQDYWEKIKISDRSRRTQYMREKRMIDPNYRIANTMRATLNQMIKLEIRSTAKPVGCNSQELRKHLESKFDYSMSWGNYGEWEIDHITPVSKFSQTEAEEFKKCWHYSNLRPLWKTQNRMKSGN